MKKENLLNKCAVILVGGSGAKLWPLSRAVCPKQFLALYHDGTTLQSAVKTLEKLSIKLMINLCSDTDGRSKFNVYFHC